MNTDYDPDYGNPYNDNAIWEDAHHYTEVDPMDCEPLDFEQEEIHKMNKKYELLDEPGTTLKRIRALRDFVDVIAGGCGGLVESEDNLSHDGDAWVYDNATVFGEARVYGDASVFGNARVYGDASVFGNAQVSGNTRVYGYAQVSGDARVYGNAQVSGDARVSGDAQVSGNAWVYGDARVSGDAHVYGTSEDSDE